jgi:hypothetical protein
VELVAWLGDELDDLPAWGKPAVRPGDLIVTASVVVAHLTLEDLDARVAPIIASTLQAGCEFEGWSSETPPSQS